MATEPMTRRQPRRIGGWLILVGIGVVLTPIRTLVVTVPMYADIFQQGMWEALTTPGSDVYHPFWAPFVLTEIAVNAALILAGTILITLFFGRKRRFPTWFIWIYSCTLVFLLLDACAIKLIYPDEPIFDQDTLIEVVRALIAVTIWTPYMLLSKRVKETFIL